MYGVHRPIIHGPWTVDHGSCALASRFCDPPRKGLLIARLISHILFAFPFFDLPSAQITCKCVPEFLHDHLPSMAARQGVVGRTPDISSSNRGPIVNLVAWIAMVTMCLSVFTVLVSKYLMLRKLTWSDVSAPHTTSSEWTSAPAFSKDRRLPDPTLPVGPELQFVGKT